MVSTEQEAGFHTAVWDGKNARGFYFLSSF
ncbi:hypothetical protein ACFL6I_00935 [candidate division KSB1 bacterium]